MSRIFTSFSLEAGAELLKAFRAPEFILPTIGMPVAFYALFAIVLPNPGAGGVNQAAYMLATYGIFAVMGPAIFGFGISVANERDKGWLSLKRAAPSRGMNYIAAKVCSTMIFASISLAVVYLVAGFAAGVTLPTKTWALLLMVHIAAIFPFILFGLTIGFLCNANAAVAISNIFFLAFAALGGLWIPVMVFPAGLQSFAQFLPSYHLSEIALIASGAPGERELSYHLMLISIITTLFLTMTIFAWNKQRNA
ncbi:ABC transporter permease [Ningiella sp. W23]|uniref:ABC transporter permease n=1 Tax=Ningiella sp. W23 TaxID=3023715 RepID=UPI0037568749